MSAASEALADVRGWLCDNLSEGDAGRVCGMLSVVSRHISALESENAKLRACLGNGCADCAVGMGEYADSICDQIKAENAKLRELGGEVASILFNLDVDRCGLCKRDDISHPCPVHTAKGGECPIKSELRELGVEVKS